jgi:subfamily B ATP-binding cassette protein MsbA
LTEKQRTWHGVGQILLFSKREWVLILFTLLAMGAYTLGEMSYLWIARPFINAFKIWMDKRSATDVSADTLVHLGKIALLLAPLVAAAAFAQQYLQGRTVWTLTVSLRNTICRAILPQSLSFFEGKRSGDLMSRITNDVNRSRMAFMLVFGDVPQQFLAVCMGIGLAVLADWRLMLISLAVFPAVIFPVAYLARRIRKYGKAGLMKLADLTDLMSQMFSGIRVIKAFKMEDAEVEEFERTNRKLFGKMMKMMLTRGISAGVIELVIRSSLGAGALLGTWLVVREGMNLELGAVVVCMGGLYYAFQGVRKLAKGYNELQEVIPAADRIFELIEARPELADAPDAVTLARMERAIAFKDVSFSYGGDLVLRDVSLELRRGERVAVVGRSGAGKSTLIALLCRFYEVSSGAVEFDGIDVRRITRDSLLDQISIVTQQTFLFNRSIADNIRYGRRDATQEKIEAAARAANIHDFIASLPDGYRTLCGEFGAKLSGGQRQRIAIARALLKDAEILILDEAMVGMDKESEALVEEAMQRLMEGRTVFVVTHDLPTIRNADRILVLEDGRLIGNGAHAELLERCPEYKALYALQFAVPSSPGPQRPLSEY